MLPFAGTLGPQNIWAFTKDSFAFLKLICESVQNDEKSTYEYKNNGDVKVRTGDIINHFHGPVIQIGELALPSYQALACLIDPQKFDHISAGPKKHKEPDIFIGKVNYKTN